MGYYPAFKAPFSMGLALDDPQGLEEAYAYLYATHAYVRQFPAPRGYKQIPHSNDLRPVLGDATKPAILDASYKHFGRNLLSVSIPDFIPSDEFLEWNDRQQKQVFKKTPGFCLDYYNFSLARVLASQGIKCVDSKIGSDGTANTHYIEYTISSEDDYERGRKIISEYVHKGVLPGQDPPADLDHLVVPPDVVLPAKSNRAAHAGRYDLLKTPPSNKAAGFSDQVALLMWEEVRSPEYGICLRTAAPSPDKLKEQLGLFLDNNIRAQFAHSETTGGDYIQISSPEEIGKVKTILADHVAKQQWERGASSTGDAVMRVNLSSFDEKQLDRLKQAVRMNGIATAAVCDDTDKQWYLEVAGKGVARLEGLLKNKKDSSVKDVGDYKWEAMNSPREGRIMRVDASQMDKKIRGELISKLQARGAAARIVHSPTFKRDYVQISAEDYQKVCGDQRNGRPQTALIRPHNISPHR